MSLVYDVLLSLLYVWCVYEAYVYDAKTQTGNILIYIIVYGGFTLLIRSYLVVPLMNLLSIIFLVFMFREPLFAHAGSYFAYEPDIGIILTILIGVAQWLVGMPVVFVVSRFLSKRIQYEGSAVIALLLSLAITIVAITV